MAETARTPRRQFNIARESLSSKRLSFANVVQATRMIL